MTETDRALALRAEFDATFAVRIERGGVPLVDVLSLRIDQELCAVRLSEVAEMTARPILTSVPATAVSLLGLSAARGRVVAAYDLSSLLGGAPANPHWLIVPAAEPTIGLVFEQFEGHRRVPVGDASTSAGRLLAMSSLVDAVRALNHDQPHRLGDAS